ncbi:MAG TPA: A/G-specific adenine glycosylase [Vicinamibacteria bacterium]|nr:A/G-specific adenine glycosylase [Vicinamibacteria bacterium]
MTTAALRRPLLAWYRRHRRELPWRSTSDPYAIWVSEVMLQQTTVKAVRPYYEAFLARFPTVHALADAAEEEVVGRWSGLGYYHRARNLHRGARHVVERHGGEFPRTLEAAIAIPGVGLYTASAVLSIAYGRPLPVVDGNVRRVLARLLWLRGRQWTRDAAYYNKAEELLDRDWPGDWNQALMELGATVCTPRRPACPVCPLRVPCRARAEGRPEELPEGRRRRAPVDVTVAAVFVERQGRVLLVRRSEGRLMGRFWEVPQTSLDGRGLADLVDELRARHGLEVEPGALLARARHAITFRRIRVEAYRGRLRREPPRDPERILWAGPAELLCLPMSSLTRKVIAGARGRQMPLDLGRGR